MGCTWLAGRWGRLPLQSVAQPGRHVLVGGAQYALVVGDGVDAVVHDVADLAEFLVERGRDLDRNRLVPFALQKQDRPGRRPLAGSRLSTNRRSVALRAQLGFPTRCNCTLFR